MKITRKEAALAILQWIIIKIQIIKVKIMPKNIFFSEPQLRILKECKLANAEEYKTWLLKNVALPLLIILLPVLFFLIFKTDAADYKSLVFNGSISLLGVNILFGMSSYLINFQRKAKPDNEGKNNTPQLNEELLNEDMVFLRSKLNTYKNILVLTGATFYIFQKMFHSYTSELAFYIFVGLTCVILVISIVIGRLMFIIRNDFFEKTFYSALNQPVVDSRDRWEKKYAQ